MYDFFLSGINKTRVAEKNSTRAVYSARLGPVARGDGTIFLFFFFFIPQKKKEARNAVHGMKRSRRSRDPSPSVQELQPRLSLWGPVKTDSPFMFRSTRLLATTSYLGVQNNKSWEANL